ncbi:trace amine-associated receptor 13c-like isoform X1 [Corythoichthys intestinalis]|uniref:trace amine-associated receptor 13c-like isoform X1 n=1 Tax=Corythoichthys intestinalis TaxID=161448 RepID=UPI0025A569B7|nr:trace amine-associated receptor 13c-like isoform X1 [Corythoichthys intestinalis]XP_057695989.1 trace amine-associated receptor 13c-like isoform X1 [Corythoichthys intestinalis]XP_061795972.1 trace amine-associated receptor 13c-like [Nerophis lumbriciformis]
MSALPNETDSAVDPGVLLATTSDPPFNLTPAHRAEIVSEQPVAPLCSICCCGFVNRTFAVVFMVSLVFAIVVGNVITLIVFVQTRQSRTPQGYLKVSLAIADMMVGVLVVPFSVYTEVSLMVTYLPPIWYQGSSASLSGQRNRWQPCMLIGPVFAGCTFVSISTIFLMTVERSVAILWPLHKDALVTRRRTLLLILLSWAASFLLALAPLVFSSNFTLEYNECSRMCNYSPVLLGNRLPRDANILLLFPVFDFTLLGGTLAINIMSFTSIRQYSRRRKLLSAGNLTDGEGGTGAGVGSCPHRPSFSDIKAAKTISILTFAFTASFSPIAVFVLGNVVGYTWCNFSFVAFWILTANSCCNVIIYSVRDHRFRKGVALLFQRDHCPPQEEKT